ncbi:putative RNA-binding protein, snRNP like protein [Synechococcus sp. PCC 7502]|uniref:Rqc2 family fibronectin-binding protein n=1 Tax=Synechococcus sp. PCC 7502 TaxID=1173263 RepID=UPI00029F9D1E|nr:NFACT RNA binding domain-containing protein [Synechococcus sp. PCC 7502]AFY73441.1 putative RNA-binding protein, snRNP like protein [Synechococcus sp. PCC 7502]
MQPVDLTTLVAICHELQNSLPAKLEQVYQSDRHTIYLALRTLEQKLWLLISWHPQTARIHLSLPPPPYPDTFTFSQQIWHQVTGLALVAIAPVSPWERVIDLQFAKRPHDPIQAHLYIEIMGKYSNVILVNGDGDIVTASHQVSSKQSRVRPIQTGDRYELPPALVEDIPTLSESLELWGDRLRLIPQPILRSLVTNYRGVSSSLGRSLLTIAGIDSNTSTDKLSPQDWQNLYQAWQQWLQCLESKQFFPELTTDGYTVIGTYNFSDLSYENLKYEKYESVNELVQDYYGKITTKQEFQQLYDQVNQILQTHFKKLNAKAQSFQERLEQSDQAELIKTHADLLMAHIVDWEQGDTSITIKDFHSLAPVTIPLDPQQNIIQNAQSLYKKYQKQKRAKLAIAPLLEAVNQEIHYLQQVYTAVSHLEAGDLKSLQEVHQELVQQGYLTSDRSTHQNIKSQGKNQKSRQKAETVLNCHRFKSPSGFEIWVGRNNYQNDQLTFKLANDYDLWLHTQEIPGSHVLLRLEPGTVAEAQDLQTAANLAAYYSQARQSDQVPVVFTKPKHVFKPKGAKPGMVIYRQEQIVWGQPADVVPLL